VSLIFQSGDRYAELEETLGAGLPAILAAVAVSLLLLLLAAIPPSALPRGVSEVLGPRRSQVAVVAVSVCLGAVIGLLTVFLTL
jgi:hypothetical protein